MGRANSFELAGSGLTFELQYGFFQPRHWRDADYGDKT